MLLFARKFHLKSRRAPAFARSHDRFANRKRSQQNADKKFKSRADNNAYRGVFGSLFGAFFRALPKHFRDHAPTKASARQKNERRKFKNALEFDIFGILYRINLEI